MCSDDLLGNAYFRFGELSKVGKNIFKKVFTMFFLQSVANGVMKKVDILSIPITKSVIDYDVLVRSIQMNTLYITPQGYDDRGC